MSARVIGIGNPTHNASKLAEQNWEMARKHYDEVCARFDARFPESIAQFHAALERRHKAYNAFMAESRHA